MRYWFYYSTQLGFFPPPDHAGLVEMICIGGVPVKKGISAGPALKYFYMINRVGQIPLRYTFDVFSVLQCVAVCCSVLQRVAV